MSSDDVKSFSQDLHELFQERATGFFSPSDEQPDQDVPESGVLLAWTVVCAWQGTDGEKWITYHRKPDQASWETRGLLSEALEDQ